MDQASAPRQHEIDDIKATAMLKATASVNLRGERMEPLSPDQTADVISTGWACVPCAKTFREWPEVERHLRETITPINQGLSEAADETGPEDPTALDHDEPPVADRPQGE